MNSKAGQLTSPIPKLALEISRHIAASDTFFAQTRRYATEPKKSQPKDTLSCLSQAGRYILLQASLFLQAPMSNPMGGVFV
jgi:hypothetical protein